MATHYGAPNRVLDTTTTTGTSDITVSGTAQAGHKTLSDYLTSNGDTGDFVIAGGSQWEMVRLTRVSANVYSRATTAGTGFYGSSTGSAINFSAGIKEVWGDIASFFSHHLNTIEIAVASATTCDIGAVLGSRIEISGTTTITGFGTSPHRLRFVRFSGALTLTHNATSLILPGAANIVTVAGDTAVFASDASGNWRWLAGRFSVLTQPNVQTFTSGSGTYTTPGGARWLRVRMVGGGGGGGASAFNSGATGSDTTFGAATASGGVGGTHGSSVGGAGGAGGAAAGGTINCPGGYGAAGSPDTGSPAGGLGGSSFFGGGGSGGIKNTAGQAATAYGGGGGGAGGTVGSLNSAGGGGAGGYVEWIIPSPSSSYSYGVGAGGAGGTAGTNAGGAGKAGFIIVEAFFG